MKTELQKTQWLPNNSIPKADLCHTVGLCFGSELSQTAVHNVDISVAVAMQKY